MIKFPPSDEHKPTDLSYTNSCISEYIACHIFNLLGVQAQETLLGTFQVGEKTKIVCACKDFTVKAKQLYDFCSIKNTIIDSETNGNGTELEEVLETIEKQQFVEPSILLAYFWDVFIIDALLGNFDRHNGNWVFFTTSIMIHPKSPPCMIVEAAFYRKLTKKSCVVFWKMKICFMRVFSNFLHQQSS